jgi:hypothetical protein
VDAPLVQDRVGQPPETFQREQPEPFEQFRAADVLDLAAAFFGEAAGWLGLSLRSPGLFALS